MNRKYQWIETSALKKICPSFATEKVYKCPYAFPYKDISRVKTPEYRYGTWVYKKGL